MAHEKPDTSTDVGTEAPYVPPRMTDDEIKDTALGLVQGRIFTGSQVPPDMLGMVFMPLALGGAVGVDWDSVGNVIEDISKANEMSVNGYPTFFSCRFVHKDDWAVIVERALKAQAALDAALEEKDPSG